MKKAFKGVLKKAEGVISEIDTKLAAAATANQPKKIRDYATKKAEFERRLVEVEEEWLELSEQLAS